MDFIVLVTIFLASRSLRVNCRLKGIPLIKLLFEIFLLLLPLLSVVIKSLHYSERIFTWNRSLNFEVHSRRVYMIDGIRLVLSHLLIPHKFLHLKVGRVVICHWFESFFSDLFEFFWLLILLSLSIPVCLLSILSSLLSSDDLLSALFLGITLLKNTSGRPLLFNFSSSLILKFSLCLYYKLIGLCRKC